VDARERRTTLVERLQSAGRPITGGALAQELGVSRQVIVGDIAILRAAGHNIYATPQGYILPEPTKQHNVVATLPCRHGMDGLEQELTIIVDNGGKILDVIVEHAIYGELKGNLMLASRRDVADFVQRLQGSGAEPLCSITGGVHLHTVEAPSSEVLAQIKEELQKHGFLLK
jgi:transcriptional regulator of NAD metabolism